MKIFYKITLLLLLAASVTSGTAFLFMNVPVNADGRDILFKVSQGESFNTVSYRLQQMRLIRSSLLARVWSRVTGLQNKIQSGTFVVNSGMSTVKILNELVNGKQVLYRVTIPEGYTISKIASILQLERICSADDFIRAAHDKALLEQLGIPGESAEGYLFPDTYMFPHDYPAEQAVRHMVRTFRARLAEVYPDYLKLSPQALAEKVSLASIVEREYRIPDEAPVMASVFYNRLSRKHRLESCATVVYILTEIQGKENPQGAITFADTEIDSPYNTYRHRGLPPAAISNPGEVALHAVFYPAKTDYMFFRITDPAEGRHIFTKTYQEHLNAYRFSIKAF